MTRLNVGSPFFVTFIYYRKRTAVAVLFLLIFVRLIVEWSGAKLYLGALLKRRGFVQKFTFVTRGRSIIYVEWEQTGIYAKINPSKKVYGLLDSAYCTIYV